MRSFLRTVLIVAVLAGANAVFPASNRANINFNQNWKFYRGEATGAEATSFIDASWETVHLPHSVRLEPKNCSGGSGNQIYLGICWYRKSFPLQSAYSGRKVFVEFQAAMQAATIWINGTLVTNHCGGYASFTVDITGYCRFDGTNNVLAARLDNRANVDIPPGTSSPDFQYFGGLYRDVILHITDRLHVTDPVFANKVAGGGIFITYPAVSTTQATVQIKTNVKNENTSAKNCSVKSDIVDGQNVIVATATAPAIRIAANADTTFTQLLTVNNPKLWHPNHPDLYKLHTFVDDSGSIVDSCMTRIGIRRFRFTVDSLSINGERTVLAGANRHQEYLYVGNAVPNSVQYRDAIKMREASFNFYRASHYPQDPEFLDACDELGIAVLACMSGWQYFGGTTFQQRSFQEIRDMVRRDRNHPSVVLWESSLNETGYTQAWAQTAHQTTHQEYPGDQCCTSADWGLYGQQVYDVTAKECSSRTKPLITREWGDQWWEASTDSSANGPARSCRLMGETDMLRSVIFRQTTLNGGQPVNDWCGVASSSRMCAYALWDFNDHNRSFNNSVDQATPGIVDVDRYPKFSYHFFAGLRDPALAIAGCKMGPMVKILNYWTAASPLPVRIASNCEQVRVYRNGALVATANPDTGYRYIAHPLFTANVTWQAGTLRADGLIGGTVVASDTARTPGTRSRIRLVVDSCGIRTVADGSDFVTVYALICDSSGTIVPGSTVPPLVDDASSSVHYQGSWTIGASKTGNYMTTESYSNTANNYCEYTFTGTKIAWIGIRQWNQGYADVYIDNVLAQANIDLYAASTVSGLVLFSRSGLTSASHTIRIVVKGTKNASASDAIVSIDAFDTSSVGPDSVRLSIAGPGSIVGDGDPRVGANPAKAEAGVAPFLVRAGTTAGTITLTASCTGLTSGTAVIQTVPFSDNSTDIMPSRGSHGPALLNRTAAFAVAGGRFLPPPPQAGKNIIAVYDICGRLLQKRPLGRASVVDLYKAYHLPEGVYIVKITRAQ